MTHIVITDCDHGSTAPEEAAAATLGATVTVAQAKSEDEIVRVGEDADGLVVQYAKITESVMERLPQLRAICRAGTGVDVVDVAAATRRGIVVTNVPDYGIEDVSDHAVALALTAARGIVRLDRGVRRGETDLEPAKPLHRFNTRTFAVIGLGAIGAATARKAIGLGFRVIAFDPALEVGTVTDSGIEVVSFDRALADGDIVSLHVPLNAHTHHLIDANTLAAMKNTATLVNTCRGGVVDTDALVDALSHGVIHSAGLDVFETEPIPADHPLTALDNVILTPHAAWYSEESFVELKRRSMENAIRAAEGTLSTNIVNPDALVSVTERAGR
ncbi:2-hydroxyacid dehydrogenase [Rhodococcus sp. 06-412-2C]|uniref:C-terminal binding protein n=1 Tax=unclassified Rhodococcus (in: high G+C Gram-positive bacteria) TaxID=192944 RepID=UPI000B9A6D2E|nr:MULTISPECIES: C-terminal binding protein [unclassified Rhodococcus (in: high G+C Gram-positive bacteria)]OZC83988.1 2-hydroxyacid dehydrogenase [Rhodococcus sp. 06-412-2C]OZC94174.1 2-hydroxyacid dehydrogenase [Rhodococcus sp. 06-412-2B]